MNTIKFIEKYHRKVSFAMNISIFGYSVSCYINELYKVAYQMLLLAIIFIVFDLAIYKFTKD
ncbi:hypothetical protein C4A77_00850 [Brevibacillus laterosporus]|uniref:Uncharacterized protein n=1 Tax=Brevibacillus laterosporus TaxID=1465 RepID=A0AAP8QHS5_BRELA|nr:hypothetical protein C4A77_00850 [Brevibacillus laterosporus]